MVQVLFERSHPRFGQLVVWVLLSFCLILAALPVHYMTGQRIGPATILAFLPDAVVRTELLYQATRITLVISALLWATQRLVPWTCWITVVSCTALWSLRMENTYHAAHIFNVTNMLLVLHAGWYQFYSLQIRQSRREGRFWTSALYPRWVYLLSVFYIGLFHTWAGLSKLRYSGIDWGNGVSLQLWIHLFGWPGSVASQLLLDHPAIAKAAQSSALLVETLAILALIPGMRVVVGLALLGLYLGILTTFVDFGFHFNALLVAMFLLPLEPYLNGKVGDQRRGWLRPAAAACR